MRALLFALLCLGCGGCTLAFNFHQCDQDSDCPPNGNKKQFCTSDNICVKDTPLDRLCTQTYPSPPPQGAIPLGALLQLPGDQLRLHAMELAIDEINNVITATAGRPLALYVCDISAGQADSLNSMRKLATTLNVVGVVGPTSSAAVADVIDIAASSMVPIISPSASASSITNLPNQGFAFRLAPSDDQQGPVLSTLVPNETSLALMYVQSAFGESVRQAFTKAWTTGDPKNKVANSLAFSDTDQNTIATLSASVVGLKPQNVLLIPGSNAATIVTQLEGLPDPMANPSHIVMSDDGKVSALLDLAKKAQNKSDTTFLNHLARVSLVNPVGLVNSPEAAAFKSSYPRKFPNEASQLTSDPYLTYSYDTLYVLALAVGSVSGDISGAAVADVLRRITDNSKRVSVGPMSYTDATSTIGQGEPIFIDGITGPIRFSEVGDRAVAAGAALFEQLFIDSKNFRFCTCAQGTSLYDPCPAELNLCQAQQ